MMSTSALEIDVHKLKKAALVPRAINHGLRRQFLDFIHKRGYATVSELHTSLCIEQSVASQHLAILRHAGFVQTKRQGKFIYYSINYERIREVHQFSEELLNSPGVLKSAI
jgi:DNA-binding transcriptional ArsR family regulator